MWNLTVARLTLSALFGRRRALLLLALPALLLILAVVFRLVAGRDDQATLGLLDFFALGTLVPLIALLAGTGSIGPEIDDGSILYLLAKPVGRHRILQTKLLVACATSTVLGGLPVLAAGVIMSGWSYRIAVGYACAATVAAIVYCTVFLLLAVVTRNSVVIGLLYVLVWESLVGGLVPGAQALSIRQWSVALADRIIGDTPGSVIPPPAGDPTGAARSVGELVTSAVSLPTSGILLVVVALGATWLAGHRLRSLRMSGQE